jgi:Tfp pilus assembly PilM family ATPase/ribosomal protein L12E/L44/L45/RPP1/RPP2
MAQRILGVDLGAYSVKVVEIEVGFRQTRLRLMREAKLLDAVEGEAQLTRATRTLRVLLDGLERPPDELALALGTDLTLRVLDLPFQDARKIDQVTGYELESQILGELDGMVVDQVVAETRGAGARVLAVAADRESVRETIAALAAVRGEPRHIGAAVLTYAALAQRALPALEPGVEKERLVDAVIDIGHNTTRVAFVEGGRTLFARSVPRGGAELTAAIADTYRVDDAAAERAKHTQAALLHDPLGEIDPSRRRLDGVLREALRPLVRELRQTFAAARGQDVPACARIALLGGTSRLPGLAEFLTNELSIGVERFSLPIDLNLVDDANKNATDVEGPGMPGVALGMTLSVTQGAAAQVNLRKGELAFQSDYGYLRGKARYLGGAVMALLACLAVNALASIHSLHKEADVLQARLKHETTELLGHAELDGKAVSAELRRGPQSGMPPVPAVTAYDVLDQISRHVPPRDQVQLDILELDIKSKKTYLKATTANAKQIDLLVAALKQIDCFGEIQEGRVSSVPAPAASAAAASASDNKDKPADGKDKPEEKPAPAAELKQFTLTIETTCP